MSILNLRNTIKGLALASVFTLGLILFSGTTASAQYGGYYPNTGRYGRDNDRYRRNERKDYEKGYKRGYKDGKNDARNRRYGNGRYGNNNGRYGNGGYGYGAYQAGYQRGYRDGYDRNRRYDRNGRYGRNGSIFGFPIPY